MFPPSIARWACAFALLACSAQSAPIEHAGAQLSANDFASSIKDGIWACEFYSPYCHHCQEFAPTWKKLYNAKSSVKDFNMGQVDCTTYGDLCADNGVKGYPSIFMFKHGKKIDSFTGARTFEKVSEWFDKHAPQSTTKTAEDAEYDRLGVDDSKPKENKDESLNAIIQNPEPVPDTKPTATPPPAEPVPEGIPIPPSNETPQKPDKPPAKPENPKAKIKPKQTKLVFQKRVPNEQGVLVEHDLAELSRVLAQESSPIFVKYYAPWCSHCKHLLPTWEKLAAALKGKVDVVKFDCDKSENRGLCSKQGVQGYPTLILYNDGEKAEYLESRDLEKMRDWALRISDSGMKEIDYSDFEAVHTKEKRFFLYAHDEKTSSDDIALVNKALKKLLGSVPLYSTTDAALMSDFGVSDPALHIFSDHSLKPAASFAFPGTFDLSTEYGQTSAASDLARFIAAHRHEPLTQLTGANFNTFMKAEEKPTLVLAALNPKILGDEKMAEYKDTLTKISKAWKKGKGETVSNKKIVHFLWADAHEWGHHLSRLYGIKKSSPTTIVLVDPSKLQHYSTDKEGKSIDLDGASVFAALESLGRGELKASHSTSFAERSGNWMEKRFSSLGSWLINHWMMAIILFVFVTVSLFAILVRSFDEGHPQPSNPYFGSKNYPKKD